MADLVEGLDFRPTYGIPVLIGLLIPIVFSSSPKIADTTLRRKYQVLQLLTLIGAIFGAKLVILMGDLLWPWVPLTSWWTVVTSGRSVVGGFLFGFLTAEVAKPLLNYPLPSNDHFARTLCFSVAVGRVGCWLSGCCMGMPWEGPLAWHDAHGVGHIPIQAMEGLFHVMCGLVFTFGLSRGWWVGRMFAVYMFSYGLYRFLTEFLRETPKVWEGFSVYQGFCVALMLAGAISYALKSKSTVVSAFR